MDINTKNPTIIGNWKMHSPNLATWQEKAGELADMENITLAIAPPFTLLEAVKMLHIYIGGQNCHAEHSGAYTGDISAQMLADCGATFCLLGHSERRQNHFESNEQVAQKANACLKHNLTPIICIGETSQQYENKQTEQVLGEQLQGSLPENGKIAIAYEPIWAIGTGRTPSLAEIAKIHGFIRAKVGEDIPLLYGGSVKPDNVGEIVACPNVNGVLVGGASLEINSFLALAKNAKI